MGWAHPRTHRMFTMTATAQPQRSQGRRPLCSVAVAPSVRPPSCLKALFQKKMHQKMTSIPSTPSKPTKSRSMRSVFEPA
jgi:hypothetical protein